MTISDWLVIGLLVIGIIILSVKWMFSIPAPDWLVNKVYNNENE